MSTPIKREDIRSGDRVRATHEFTAGIEWLPIADDASTYELIERPVVLPTEPGVYLDKDGEVWDRLTGGALFALHADYAPYTLLRTEVETALDLLREVRAMYTTDDPTYWGKLDALTAKWATK